jgi:hypothetical protein
MNFVWATKMNFVWATKMNFVWATKMNFAWAAAEHTERDRPTLTRVCVCKRNAKKSTNPTTKTIATRF